MDNWTQISTFTLPHEAHLAKAKLESEGIETMIQDELTAQVHNFYSNAIGGVKLFVKDSEAIRAIEILKEAKIIKEVESSQNTFLLGFDEKTQGIPLIGNLIVEFRLIVLITLLIALIIIPIILLSLPSTKEKITDGRWCIESFYYDGKEYQPNTTGMWVLDFGDGCRETFNFSNHTMSLPGFNSPAINAHWKLEKKNLTIFMSDTLGHIFDRKYKVQVDNNKISLVSEKTILTGTKY